MVDFPVVTFSRSQCSINSLTALAEETDCANLAFDRVYSWPGYTSTSDERGREYEDFCIGGEGAEDFIEGIVHFFGGSFEEAAAAGDEEGISCKDHFLALMFEEVAY